MNRNPDLTGELSSFNKLLTMSSDSQPAKLQHPQYYEKEQIICMIQLLILNVPYHFYLFYLF